MNAGWVEPLRMIYDHEFLMVFRGRLMVELDSRPHECSAGSFFILPPGRWHVVRNAGPGITEFHWSHFNWLWTRTMEGIPFTAYYPSRPRAGGFQYAPAWIPRRVLSGMLANPERIDDLFCRMRRRWRFGSGHHQLTCRALLLEMLLEALAPGSGHVTSATDGSLPVRMKTVLDRLAFRPLSESSIQASLSELGCSYAYLCREFKKAHGISPVKYVNAVRIERARQLLLDTNLQIAEIAYKTGFESPDYFSRLFRRFTGSRPRDYRAGAASGA